MGCKNQWDWLQRYTSIIEGPVLEVGSRRYGKSGFDLRTVLPDREYIGADMEPGEGVDVIVDLTAPIIESRAVLGWAGFNTVICFSTLEHCAKPWVMADNISALLYQGGLLFVSVPFAWKLHDYPKDYWRFTPDGVKALFQNLDWEKYPVRTYEACYENRLAKHLLRPTLVNMIGVKR